MSPKFLLQKLYYEDQFSVANWASTSILILESNLLLLEEKWMVVVFHHLFDSHFKMLLEVIVVDSVYSLRVCGVLKNAAYLCSSYRSALFFLKQVLPTLGAFWEGFVILTG